MLAKGCKVSRVNELAGNTDTDRGRLGVVVYLCTPPQVERSGVVQMLLPDVDHIVISALCSFTFLKLFARVRTHTHMHMHIYLSSRVEVCIAQ